MHEIDLRRIDLNLLVVFDVLMAERSVTRAAAQLGRTQSTVSHSLARLREQLGDPLMVKSGGRMAASPFAEGLVHEVRLILANVRRVLVPPQAFAAAGTTRAFRIAMSDLNDALFPLLAGRVQREAPSARLEWSALDEHTLMAVAEGQIDIALLPAAISLPAAAAHTLVRPIRWASYVRQGHPAIKTWGKAAWSKWPHVAVRVPARLTSPVESATREVRSERHISTWVPHFSAVAPLIARTDLIATFPVLVMADVLERYRLCALRAPVPLKPMQYSLIWSKRLGNDPALVWLRAHVEAVFAQVLDAAEAAMPG